MGFGTPPAGVPAGAGNEASAAKEFVTFIRGSTPVASAPVRSSLAIAELSEPLARRSAARPAACAAAADVPENVAYAPPGCVVYIATPGAPMRALPVMLDDAATSS